MISTVRTHLGYIPFEGRLGKHLNNTMKFHLEMRKANLQPVIKVTYTFDPMTENCHTLRNFMFFLNTKKVKKTNLKMLSKVEIGDDRRDPTILMNLSDGRDLEIRTGNLTELEISIVVNTYLLPLVKEDEVETVTKSEKKASGKPGRK